MKFGEETAAALAVMRKQKKMARDYLLEDAVSAGYQLTIAAEGLPAGQQDIIVALIRKEIPLDYPQIAVWWYSVLMGVKKDPSVFLEFITYIRANRNAFSLNTQYFLFYQLKSARFQFSVLHDPDNQRELWYYFKEVVEGFAEGVRMTPEWIPAEKRDDTLAVVITEQFLKIQHGPSKTAMDRCMALITRMRKRVILINTAEVLSQAGRIAYAGSVIGNYMPGLNKITKLDWKGITVPYHQCSDTMPDQSEIEELLGIIRKLAPGYVIAIGGSGILANLVSRMLPVLTVGLCPSDLEFTMTQFQTLSRRLTSGEKNLLAELGYDEDDVIESIFTSGLKAQAERITRGELGVSDDKFLMIVVGARLDTEVTNEFMKMLDETVSGNMHVGFLGWFYKYEEWIKQYPRLRDYTSHFGFCADILSRLEVCDLYLNPLRQGGGTSCVEAMFMGLPVVTIGYGDVAVNAGDAFWVSDYAEMKAKIIRYQKDRMYYDEMSKQAKKRAAILLDTETEFTNIIEIYAERMRQKEHKGDRGE
ncbi:MAG: glycosyltransferase [Roseburia sp.]|jgi:hypothetical protein|nr:glycosyltransferase [Roseburia sp.]